MSLSPGQSLSFYEILSPLGSGAMGDVFRARDTRLDREVAIKVLPQHFVDDDERLKRFEREAKALASLNHPNVAQIYGVDQVDDTCFLVLELIEGESLAERLKRGPLPVLEAMDVMAQIAEALEAAHETGVIHRDLKPANVHVTPDGRVKVLDFGLAKSSRPGVGETQTASSDSVLSTEAGRLLGTPTYMAPEQARGKPIDRRVDVWAFGCVLYECVTGKRAFDGESIPDVLAAVLDREPDFSVLPESTPRPVHRLLRSCLVKDPRNRLRDVGDARLELRGPAHDGWSPAVTPPPVTSGSGRMLAAFAAGAALVAVAAWSLRPRTTIFPPQVSRFALTGMGLAIDAFQGIALSPDGKHLVFRAHGTGGRDSLHVRSLDSLEDRALPGTELGWLPFFAPDSDRICFHSLGEIKVLSLSTGLARSLGWMDVGFSGGTWLPDDTIVFTGTQSDRFLRVSAAGGEVEQLEIEAGPETDIVSSPEALPGGAAVLCAYRSKESFNVGVYDLAERSLTLVAENGFTPVWSDTGHVVYQQGADGQLMALPFDSERKVATGESFPVSSDVGTRVSYQVRMFDVAANGTLAYIPRSSVSNRGALFWVDQNGDFTLLTELDKIIDTPRLSNDGRHVAFRSPAPECDVWVHDIERGVTTRITQEGDNHGIAWSPDDSRIAFTRVDDPDWALVSAAADGVGKVEAHSEAIIKRGFAAAYSPDGESVLVVSQRDETGLDIERVSIADGSLETLIATRHNEHGPSLSPDGRYIAYVSNESQETEVYVQPFPGLETRAQISTGGGTEPVWSRDGRTLYFRSGSSMMAVDVTTSPSFEAGRPRGVFEGNFVSRGASGLPDFDVSIDGERFLMVGPRAGAEGSDVHVVLNWFAELEAIQPSSK